MLSWLITPFFTLIKWSRKHSMWPLTFGLACCAIEMIHAAVNKYDIERLGLIFRPTPKNADLLILAGTITNKMIGTIRRIYELMTWPRFVLSMGSCSSNGGYYHFSYSVLRGAEIIIPVDIFIPGCPPCSEALLYGIIALQVNLTNN